MEKHIIAVLGGGFGGLRAAKKIAKGLKKMNLLDSHEVVLIEKNDHQTYTPLLYEVATTSKETANLCDLHAVAAYPLREIIGNLPVTLMQRTVKKLDVIEGDIHFEDGGNLVFDYAVLALGSETNYFGIPGLEENSFPLKTFRDAIRLRDRVLSLMQDNPSSKMRIVLGGAGPNGVELAAELKSWCGELEEELKSCNLEITLVEGGSGILGGMAQAVVDKAARRLDKIGVNVVSGNPISSVTKNSLSLKDGKEIGFDILVWTGGVKVSSVFSDAPLKKEARGRIEVADMMLCLPQTPDLKLRPMIYALGDAVCVYDSATGKPVPGVARSALEQAVVVAANILEDVKREAVKDYSPRHTTYKPMSYPYVIPVGGKFAVAKIGPVILSGIWGWFFKGLVELNYLLSIMEPRMAFRTWFRGLRIFITNDRLG